MKNFNEILGEGGDYSKNLRKVVLNNFLKLLCNQMSSLVIHKRLTDIHTHNESIVYIDIESNCVCRCLYVGYLCYKTSLACPSCVAVISKERKISTRKFPLQETPNP